MSEWKLIYERFQGKTKYQTNNNETLEHATHWCFSLMRAHMALKRQKEHFESAGTKILSQRIRREATTEIQI